MAAKVIFPDAAQSTKILASTETSGEIMIRQGGMYLLGVTDLPDAAVVTVAVSMGGSWVTVDTVKQTDLVADGSSFSGVAPARLSVGNWRVSVAAAGPTVYIGAAGKG